MVNRIWLHHFGRGIVATPNDFGKQGKPPTHPELLDYLAAKFRDGGWSVKAMHRLIMLSRTYQHRHARATPTRSRSDPANELLASFPRRRLDAEAIRDTLLALGGNLDLTPAGPHPFPPRTSGTSRSTIPSRPSIDSNRRSVYLMTQRIQRHPYLAIFDGADPSASTPARTDEHHAAAGALPAQRSVRPRAIQARRRAHHFARQRRRRPHPARLRAALRPPACRRRTRRRGEISRQRARATSRATTCPPTRRTAEAWRAYVRVLFRLNEFVYLD